MTDANGNTTTGTILVDIIDDVPTAVAPAAISVTNQAGSPVTAALDVDSLINNYGADGGTVRFASSLNGADSGLTSNTTPIIYNLSSDGKVLTGVANGVTIFTVTLLPDNAQYQVDMDGTVDSLTTIQFTDAAYDFIGGNKGWFGIVPNGQDSAPVDDGSEDVLITPIGGTSVNTSGILGGIGTGQSVGAGEGFRLDYVVDLTGAPPNNYTNGAANGHSFDSHWVGGTNGASISFRQSTGTELRFQAFDDTNADAIVGNGTLDTINKIAITYNGISSGLLTPTSTVQSITVGSRTFTYRLDADGQSVLITNIGGANGNSGPPETTVSIFTATGFNSLEVEHVSGPDIKFSGFGATTQSSDPVNFNVPVVVVDNDGDVSASANLAITLTAPLAPPIVLDLDGDGAEFLSTAAGVAFDYADDGNPESTAWVGADDGLLAIDSNGNGLVDNGSEIVFGGNGLTDLQGLAANYDSNKDGVLDASDADFAKFGVWQDANSNGVTEAGEFRSLTDAGITSINLVSDGVEYAAASGEVTVHGTSSYTKADGTTGEVADASFATAGESKVAANENDQRVLASANTGMASSLVAAGLVAAIAGAGESANNQPEQLGGSDFAVRTVAEDMASDTPFDAPDHNALFNSDSGSSGFEGADLIDTAKFSSYDQVEDHADGDFGGFGEMDSGSLLSDLLASTEIEHANFAQTGFAIGSHVDAASEALIAIQQGDMFAKAAIEEVVADALAGGFGEGANVDALLNALAGPANDTLLLGDTLAQQFGDHPAFEALNFAAANDMLDQLASTHMELSAATGQHG